MRLKILLVFLYCPVYQEVDRISSRTCKEYANEHNHKDRIS